MWLSLVERCVRDAEAAGSNPVIPTIAWSRLGVRTEPFSCNRAYPLECCASACAFHRRCVGKLRLC